MGLSVGCKGITSGAEMKSRLFGLATKSAKGVVVFNVSKVTPLAAARINSSEMPSRVQALQCTGYKLSEVKVRWLDSCC